MRRLTLTKAHRGGVSIELRDENGPAALIAETFRDDKHYRRASKVLGIDKADILRHVDALRKGEAETLTVELGDAAPEAFAVLIRSKVASEHCASFADPNPLTAFAAALNILPAALPPEPLILWDKERAGELCMVDVDLHHVPFDERPLGPAWYDLTERVAPRPAFAWSTHGRGLRLVYGAAGGLGADELAAVAALGIASADPTATIELKTVTRHPAYPVNGRECGPVRAMQQTADLAPLGEWLRRREVEDSEVAGWLEVRGLEAGRRYPHEHCPARPGEASKGDPVQVGELGIYCHSCAGRGIRFGSRKPGWFPYASLCGGVVSTLVSSCIDNLTHWEHARFVLAEAVGGLGLDVAKAAYAAALKVRHPGDPRAIAAMHAGENLIRVERDWTSLEGHSYGKQIEGILGKLPGCQYMGDEGPRTDPDRLDRFRSGAPLDRYGYTDLGPVWGMRIFGHFLPLTWSTRVPIVLQTGALARERNAAFRPRYRAEAQREFSEVEAWAVLEEAFPGVNRDAIYLLLAARGCAEGEIGLPPMIFLTGPTSAGKTTHVQIAAAIAGDRDSSVPMVRDVERVRAAVRAARDCGSFCVFNEAAKDGARLGMSALEAMDFALNLTADSISHKLYVGPVPLGQLPVFCWTDTVIPEAVKQSGQLARRIVEVHLPRRVDWVASIRDTIGQVPRLRLSGMRWASACDTIVSVAIDRFFRYPRDFAAIAGELGFGPLAESAEAVEGLEMLRELFEAVCLAPDISGPDAKRWRGRGWKVIDRNGESDLATVWRQLGDGAAAERRCSEVDWAKLIGCPPPVAFDSRAHGNRVAVRFRRGDARRPEAVNGELRATAPVSLEGLDFSSLEGVAA